MLLQGKGYVANKWARNDLRIYISVSGLGRTTQAWQLPALAFQLSHNVFAAV